MKFIYLPIVACSMVLAQACVSTDTKTTTQEQRSGVVSSVVGENGQQQLIAKTLKCDRPVAKVSIAPLKCQASQCKELPEATGNFALFVKLAGDEIGPDFSQLGATMSTMIGSSLEQTGCFNVLDREALAELKQEMALSGQLENWKPETADILITGAITSLTYQKRETGIAGTGVTLGLFSNEERTARIGIDMRVIDVNSSSVVYTKAYQSDATNNSYAFGLGNTSGSNKVNATASFGGDLEIEEAVRTILNQSVFDLVKHEADGIYKEEIVITKL